MGLLVSTPVPSLRDADPARDAAACAAIYAPYVADAGTSFEYEPPGVSEIAARMAAAHVWLVAENAGGEVIGYAYASRHRDRAGYDWTADVAIYLDRAHHGAGLGRALYVDLFERLTEQGFRMLCAGVTLPNAASEGLHRAMGFEPVGTYRSIGWKAGAWHDVRWWQLDLRPGDGAPPAPLRS